MKLLFSETHSDYSHYIFPYAIWAVPETQDKVSDFFNRGFLPGSRNMDRYYLCRQIRVHLSEFSPSSENRRILRKGEGITAQLLKREDFSWNTKWRRFCKQYADIKFGYNVMTNARLDRLFSSPVVSHIMLFRDEAKDADVGIVTLYIDSPDMAYYYYAFYDLNYFKRNLGMYMMTRTVADMQERGIDYLYLGTCYSRNALYKIQFNGAEFFNGFAWSRNMNELKYLLKRDGKVLDKHLLETEEFVSSYYQDSFQQLVDKSIFRLDG